MACRISGLIIEHSEQVRDGKRDRKALAVDDIKSSTYLSRHLRVAIVARAAKPVGLVIWSKH